MASGDDIQVDMGGYVRIHNTILEKLAAAPLRGTQFRCLMFLFRKTYGFNKKEDKISLKEWEAGTDIRRQNVWRELRLLLEYKVIYSISNGPKRPMTWGFNKYFEQWNFISVITDDDTSVIISDDKANESVIISNDKSVIIPSHTRELKDNKDKQSLPAADDDSDQAMLLVRESYSNVGRIGPPTRTDDGRANLIIALDLIERYGFPACIRGLSTLKERNNAMILRNARNGIRAPVAYLRSMLDGEKENAAPVAVSVPSCVDFALEQIA